jgi:hypothetical protein
MVKLASAYSKLFFANYKRMKKKSRKVNRQRKRYRELGEKKLRPV